MNETHVLFKIITQKPIAIDIPEKAMLEFPIHEHYLVECTEKLLIYKVKTTKKTAQNFEKYIEFLKKFFKAKYNAYSVEIGSLQNQIEK